jgi:predicted chitinase
MQPSRKENSVGKTKKVQDGLGGGAEAAELFTVEQLTEISQNRDPVANDLAGDVAALIPEMRKGGIVTKNRITAFLANVCQETDHLNTLEEYGGHSYWLYLDRNSGRPGEWRYHGRGYIMLTWSDNYRACGNAIGVDLVNNPDLLKDDKEVAARAAVWYWNSRNCSAYADRGDFGAVCELINRGVADGGPVNGWEERLAAYERAKAVIGTGTEPLTELASEPEIETSEPAATAETGLLTAVAGTNFHKGLTYVKPLIGNMLYWVWMGGHVPDGEGMYAVNAPLPPNGALFGRRVNCAGTTNLFFRAAGKRVPTRGNSLFDGGVGAYFDSPSLDPMLGNHGYFHGYDEPFDLQKAKRWAEETRSGVLIGRPYVNETLGGQGHVAVLLPSGYVLQSFQSGPSGQPGLNWAYTIEESHAGGYYTRMVAPENWIDYDGDEF